VSDNLSLSARFTELYRREYGAVYRFLARRGATNPADLAHETFTTAWRRLAIVPLTDDAAARAWLFATARNHLLHEQRAIMRADQLSIKIADSLNETMADPGIGQITAMDLKSAWVQLPPAQQELLVLLGWEGLTVGQAAKVLRISTPTARLRLQKARATLRRLLAEFENQQVAKPYSQGNSQSGLMCQEQPELLPGEE